MNGTHSPVLVTLSVAVAIVASYVVLAVAGRMVESRGSARRWWLAGGSVAMGLGLWSMHFVAMLALRLPVPVAYDIPLWLLSALLAIAASAFALSMAGRRPDAGPGLLPASTGLAVGIAGMHFLGMAAIRIPGRVAYRSSGVAASLVIAFLASYLVLLLAVRLRRDESPRFRLRRVGAAVVMGSAIAAMHFTAMAAVVFHAVPGTVREDVDELLASDALAASVVVATAVVLGIALAAAVVDRAFQRRTALAEENRRLYEAAAAAQSEARERATQAEEMAEQLQSQAVYLEEQTAELESINQELERTGARLRSVVNSALDGIVTIDADGRVIDWSRSSEQIFGWSAEEAVGRRLAELIIPPRYQEAHRRGMERYLATGEHRILNRRIEITGLRRDRSEFPVELAVAPARAGTEQIFSAFIRDISGERLAERRVEAEHEVVRVLAESHTREEAAPRVLEAVGAALGWEAGVFWAVVEGEDTLRFVALWRSPACSEHGLAIAGPNIHFARGQGLPGRVWAHRRAEWIRDIAADPDFPRAGTAIRAGLKSAVAFPILHAGEVLGVIEFFNEEVVEPEPELLEMIGALGIGIGQAMRRIGAEEERDQAMHRVEEANVELARRSVDAERARALADEANRAKSDFLATMSHELRTPLNAILGYADLLEMQIEGPLTEGQLTQLKRIEASGRHLLMLIEDVLDLAKIEARRLGLEHRREGVEDAAVGAVALVEPQAAERRIEVINECLASRVAFLGDANRLRQILLNLLSNAVKFTEPGGRVVVRCGTAEEAPPEWSAGGKGPWSYVEVEDNGIGIAPSEARSIFEPFVQAETGRTRGYGGTGLGLTISQQLANLMGGEITLRSAPGRGSCFTVWLPAPGAAEAAPTATEAAGPAGLAQLGARLQAEQESVVSATALRMRTDPETPLARDLDDAALEDHQSAFVVEIAELLMAVAEPEPGPHLLVDGNDLRRYIASRHGAQRARLGWTRRAVEREYEILAEEIGAALHRCSTASTPKEVRSRALETAERAVSDAARSALDALRRAASG